MAFSSAKPPSRKTDLSILSHVLGRLHSEDLRNASFRGRVGREQVKSLSMQIIGGQQPRMRVCLFLHKFKIGVLHVEAPCWTAVRVGERAAGSDASRALQHSRAAVSGSGTKQLDSNAEHVRFEGWSGHPYPVAKVC